VLVFDPICGFDPYISTAELSLSISLSVLTAIGPGLAGNRMSPFWISLELRVMEVVVTAGATRRAKLQSKCHHQQANAQYC